jgi:hypothetical protein
MHQDKVEEFCQYFPSIYNRSKVNIVLMNDKIRLLQLLLHQTAEKWKVSKNRSNEFSLCGISPMNYSALIASVHESVCQHNMLKMKSLSHSLYKLYFIEKCLHFTQQDATTKLMGLFFSMQLISHLCC